MGLFTYTMAGTGFILMGSWEALTFTNSNHNSNPSSPLSSIHALPQPSSSKTKTNPFSSSSLTFISISVLSFLFLSFLFLLNSLISFFDALNSSDKIGSALQLQVLALAWLFLLYSLLGFLVNFTNLIPLPCSLLDLIGLFAFVEEFLLFYLQRKDPSGIENRYFDLLLVPVTVCVFATMIELKSPKSNYPKLARGVGLILQGTWFVQMGISFYTDLIANGCSLQEKSRGNYTIRCKGHPDYHRARAIATLQFNCHLALIVVLVMGMYSIIVRKYGVPGDFLQYRPLGAEMQQFTLNSDDDDGEEINVEENLGKKNVGMVELSTNGYGSH